MIWNILEKKLLMAIWFQTYNNQFEDDYVFAAYLGFKLISNNIRFFENTSEILYNKNDVVVGTIESSRYIFNKLGISVPNLYIPDELSEFTGRKIEKSTIKDALNRFKNKEKIFIKPVVAKRFPAQVVDGLPLMTYVNQNFDDTMECWISEVVNFVSEYRIFLNNNEIIGCKHYLGDYKIFLDWNIIETAVKSLKCQPAGWCLDFGVTDDNKTLLIEANDGYSLGNYGLDTSAYCKLLKDRWIELTSGKCGIL